MIIELSGRLSYRYRAITEWNELLNYMRFHGFLLFSIAQGGNEIDEKANAGAAEVNTAAGVSSKDSVEKVDEAEMNKESGKAEEEHAESEMTESKKSDDPHAEHEHHHHHHHHHQNKEEKNALAGLFDILSLSRACLYD